MKKLIAKTAIQYGGRVYEPGAAIPAHEQRMVDAWLRAGSAIWQEDAQAASPEAESAANAVVEALSAMGVHVMDESNAFIGADALEQALRTAFAPQESTKTAEKEAAELQSMSREQLDTLAASMDLDSSKCKTKADVIALIASKSGSAS